LGEKGISIGGGGVSSLEGEGNSMVEIESSSDTCSGETNCSSIGEVVSKTGGDG
jgi:hypothetical protein